MNTIDILKRARNRILNGFTKHAYETNGCYCALGAIRFEKSKDTFETKKKAEDFLYSCLPPKYKTDDVWDSITYYNDEPSTTQKDVAALFTKAIRKAIRAAQSSKRK